MGVFEEVCTFRQIYDGLGRRQVFAFLLMCGKFDGMLSVIFLRFLGGVESVWGVSVYRVRSVRIFFRCSCMSSFWSCFSAEGLNWQNSIPALVSLVFLEYW